MYTFERGLVQWAQKRSFAQQKSRSFDQRIGMEGGESKLRQHMMMCDVSEYVLLGFFLLTIKLQNVQVVFCGFDWSIFG